MEYETKIYEYEKKIAKNGNGFFRFKTDNGWIGCFDVVVADKVKAFVGGMCTLDVADNGTFKRIVGLIGEGKIPEIRAMTQAELQRSTSKACCSDDKYTAMYVSYVKDLVVAGKTLDEAVGIITSARLAFSD